MRIFLIIFSTLLFGCSKQKPVLSQADREFASIMVEVYLANGLANQLKNGNRDSFRNVLFYDILKNNDLDTMTFNRQIKKFEQNPEKFKLLYDTINRRLEVLRGNK
jgi:hypothetical protein